MEWRYNRRTRGGALNGRENDRDESPKQIPLRDLKVDPTAEDLLDSAAMEPYLNLAVAMMTGGKDTGPAIEELAALPLEKRYVWRVK